MENSSEKSGAVEFPKKKRSLDLKSIYNSGVSGVGKDGENTSLEIVKKKKRKTGKEVSLSTFGSDAKKSRKEGGSGVKSELGFNKRPRGRSKGLHGISLDMGGNGNTSNFPKRPRGLMGWKKLQIDQATEPLSLSNSSPKSVDRAGTFNDGVIKCENKVGPTDRLVRPVNPSAGNHGASNPKSAREVSGSNSKINQKKDLESTDKGNSSNAKLKRKAGAQALKERKKGRISYEHVEEEDSLAVNNGDMSSEKQQSNSKKKQELVVTREKSVAVDNGEMSSKKQWGNSRKKKDFVVEEQNSVAVDNGDMSSKKQGIKSGKKKDLVAGKENNVAVNNGDMSSKQWSKSGKKKDLVVGEDNSIAINNGDMSSKKQQSNSRRKDSVVGSDAGKASRKKSEPSVLYSVPDNIVQFDDDDEDEENLEENAARMLSSRFDPSCTGFSSMRKSSISQTVTECSIPVSSSRDSVNRQANSSSVLDSASADEKSKVLRSRTEDKGKGTPRKRRHFYEIIARDLDPQWVLNRRIKVFWPVDESWYYGLVDDYCSEWRLHHIKYDDREDDWINIHDEKFKVLCFPSELPGKLKSKRVSLRKNDEHKGKKILPEDDDRCMGKYLDSEPIAIWLTRSSQRGKSLTKSFRTQRTSPMELSMASSLSEKTGNKYDNLADPKRTRSDPDFESSDNLFVRGMVHKSVMGDLNGSRVVYARRKCHKKGEGSGSMSRDIKEYASTSGIVTSLAPTVHFPAPTETNFYGYLDYDELLWSIDHQGLLRLNVVLVDSRQFRFQICLPLLSPLGTEDFWLFRNTLMHKHWVLMPTSPVVVLEMLFIDSYLGLRFLLFEGCMKQALAFVFLIFIAFSQLDEQVIGCMQSPVTSIRLRLSSAQDLRNHHIFQCHSFSRLQSSKWICLDYQLLQHCLLIKQLRVSECTYNNFKELESGSLKQCKPNVVLELPSFMGLILTGFSEEACSTRTSQSALNLVLKPGKVPQFGLSSSAAPTLFLTLHLQLLMEKNSAWGNHNPHDALCSLESGHDGVTTHMERVQYEHSLVSVQDISAENETGKLEGLISSNEDLVADVTLVSKVVEKFDSSENFHRENPKGAVSALFLKDDGESTPKDVSPSHQCETELLEEDILPFPSSPTPTTWLNYNSRSSSRLGRFIVDIPSSDQIVMPLNTKACISRQLSDMGWNVNEGSIESPNPNGSRCSREGGRDSLISSPSGNLSPYWSDSMCVGFSNGPKRRRTQVQYTLPGAGYDFMPRQNMQDQRALPCKRIRKASLKRISDGSRSKQKNFELLSCDANVLVTRGNKGWRECGALIVLEVADDNEWRLAIKLAGITKYSLNVKHVLQPGANNRYSHAMLWKGGKDWVLEFPDKSQWTLFKEMHEECYNRNIRATSVKNIPIPGVRLLEESDDYGTEIPFIRNSLKYFRQVQTDVEMAIDPSLMLYDMDSDDEQWLMANKKPSCRSGCKEITEEFLEKTMDMFEKVAYVQHQDKFTDAEIEELAIGIGSAEAAKVVYQHWREKRDRKGMPLIRHLQPSLWQSYQQQLKEWEVAVAQCNSGVSVGSQEKLSTPEKPPTFAFCLKPRGLDVPNRGSKQRTHRKFSVSGPLHTVSGDHGRRSNAHTIGDEKFLYTNSVYESFDESPSLLASKRVLSSRTPHFSLSTDLSKLSRNSKAYKHKARKLGLHPSSDYRQMISHNQTTRMNTNEVELWNMNFPDLSNQRHYHFKGSQEQGVERLNDSDLHQLRLHDASGAAERARKVAKLKKEKAHKLFYTADLAMHRAVAILMNAEAMKASANENLNGGD